MNRPRTAAAILFLALLSTSCISNHSFADHDGQPPNTAALERALAASEPDTTGKRALGDLMWIPLVATQFDHYGPSEPALLPGNTLLEAAYYGPVFMNGSADTWAFDENDEPYERRRESHVAWGLFASKELLLRVPTGWRVDRNTSLLFGLLRWPTTAYTTRQQLPE